MRGVNDRFSRPVTLVVVWTLISLVLVSVVVYLLELMGRVATWAVIGLVATAGSIWFARAAAREERRDVATQRQFSAVILGGFAIIALGKILFGST